MSMIWIKTDIGRAEISGRTLVPERLRRTLLLLIDGIRSQDALLHSVAGSTPGDFDQLARLGLITRLQATVAHRPPQVAVTMETTSVNIDVLLDDAPTPSYAQLTTRLTQLISSQLGLRGFRLTLAVEKSAGVPELLQVAERVLAEIAQRKGADAAAQARRQIFSA